MNIKHLQSKEVKVQPVAFIGVINISIYYIAYSNLNNVIIYLQSYLSFNLSTFSVYFPVKMFAKDWLTQITCQRNHVMCNVKTQMTNALACLGNQLDDKQNPGTSQV